MALDSGPWPIEDADLVQRLARGDASAFDAIVIKYQPRITGLVFRLLGWRHDVDDVVQEVFLSALRGLPRFRGDSSLSTWLSRIAVNQCRSHQRRRKFSLRVLFTREQEIEPPPAMARTCPAADGPILDAERFEQVRRAIDGLPTKDREVIVLRYLEQMSIEEMSELLSLRAQTIHVRLHRGRAKLKGALKELVKE